MSPEKIYHEEIGIPVVSELNRRSGDGLEVVLWWVHGTLSTYVEVTDARENNNFIVETPEGVNALDVFTHPFAYKAAEVRQNGSHEG